MDKSIEKLILRYENHIQYMLDKTNTDDLIDMLDCEEIKIFKKVLIDLYKIKNSHELDFNLIDDLDEDLFDMLKG